MEKTIDNKDQLESKEAPLLILMEAYKIYQDTNKHPQTTVRVDTSRDRDDCTHQRLLAEAFQKYTCFIKETTQDDTKENNLTVAKGNMGVADHEVASLVEKALKFCQQKHRQMCSSKVTADNVAQSNTQSSGTKRPLVASKPPQITMDSVPTEKAAELPKDDNPTDSVKVQAVVGDIKTTEVVLSEGVSGGKVTMVEKDGRTYTKIQTKPFNTNRNHGTNHGFSHLQAADQNETKLRRATSLPLADEGVHRHRHRTLFRTGSSVSDSTKSKLRSTILQRKSAALIRKPSITDREIEQIAVYNEDDDDDDDDDDEFFFSDEENDIEAPYKKAKMETLEEEENESSEVKDKPDGLETPISPCHVTMTTAAS